MMTFGPMIGASAMPPAAFGGDFTIDLTAVVLPLAWAVAGLVAIVLVERRRRRGTEAGTRVVVSKPAGHVAA
jgi:heme/copper-type cytochrome/quinol oxidase subunit 2